MSRYWWRVFKQALTETMAWISSHLWQAITAFAVAFIAGGIIYQVADEKTWKEKLFEELINPTASLILVLLIFLALLGWRLFSVPARWDQEKNNQISFLSEKLNNKANRPRIEIPFDGPDHHFSKTHFGTDVEDKAIFVSVRAIARPIGTYIKECIGFVDAVYLLGPNGEWIATTLDRPQILEWSSEGTGGSAKSDLDSDKGRFLNIFHVRKRDNVIRPCIPQLLHEYIDIFNDRNQIYKFDIRVRSYGETESGLIQLKISLGEN